MIQLRKSDDRGHARHGWLDSYHTFSFANYYDPKFSGFRDLLVINEDTVQPGQGFGKHPHQDMEIISYVLEGELAHKDSTGTSSILRPGDVQRMSAGRGIVHSEFNNSNEKPVHFLQIWISPSEDGIKPGYQEKQFSDDDKKNRLRLIVSPEGSDGSLKIHQDAKLYSSILEAGKEVRHEMEKGRHAWIQVIRGTIEVNGTLLEEGDGAAVSDEKTLKLISQDISEFLLFDLN